MAEDSQMPYADKRKERQSKHDRYEKLKQDPEFQAKRKKYRDENAQRNRDYQEIYRLTHAKELEELKRRRKGMWKSHQRAYQNEYQRQRAVENRLLIIQNYGGKCACCGESGHQFLQLDHSNNDGAAHRKVAGVGQPFYRWIIRHGFPKEGFRLLCANCNFARGRYGFCHERVGEKISP
jgi:hypothetical protein